MTIQNWRAMARKMKITVKMEDNIVRDIVRESQNYDKLKFMERWKEYNLVEKKRTGDHWLKWLKSHIKTERLIRAIKQCA